MPCDDSMTPEQQRIKDRAIRFANHQKKAIARALTDKDEFPPDAEPVSIFMAGSPGAGKTEASRALLELLSDRSVMRIDPDDLRDEFQDYDGQNSWLFQPAVAILVERIHDYVLKKQPEFHIGWHTFVACKGPFEYRKIFEKRPICADIVRLSGTQVGLAVCLRQRSA